MDLRSATILVLLPLLLQLAVVPAAPVKNTTSTSQTCDSSKTSSYLRSLLKLRNRIRSRPRTCTAALTSTFPGQSISPSLCNANTYIVGKYIPLEIPDHIVRANKLFEEQESSGAEEPERFCPSRINLSIQSCYKVEGANFALYKIPSLRSNNAEMYTVTVMDRDSGETVMTRKVSGNASGWQITDISTYAKKQAFSRKRVFYFNIYVKRSDGSHLPCQEMKTIFALDCAVPQDTNNFPFTEDIQPALAVYASGEFDPFKLLGKRSIRPALGQGPRNSAACEKVSNVINLQNYIKDGYRVVEPVMVDRGQCVSTTMPRTACAPQETRDQWVVISKDGIEITMKLKNFITHTC